MTVGQNIRHNVVLALSYRRNVGLEVLLDIRRALEASNLTGAPPCARPSMPSQPSWHALRNAGVSMLIEECGPMHLSRAEVVRRLRARQAVPDYVFDGWLRPELRVASPRFWTSVSVTAMAAEWLSARGVKRVLDVGSGAGKFCVVGALCSDLTFVGIEHRPHLVEAAQELAQAFGVSDRVEFIRGEFGAEPLPGCDALYFYNPFGEMPFPRSHHLDRTVELGDVRFTQEMVTTARVLTQLALGTFLVTYNGFGGGLPDTFDLLRAKNAGVDQLRLWRKARERWDGARWLELEGATVLRRADSAEVLMAVLPEPKDFMP